MSPSPDRLPGARANENPVSGTGAALLRFHDLGFQREGDWVFRGLECRLQPGECLVVTGANGSGKTTLLRSLAGLLAPHEGTIHWRGEDRGELGCPPEDSLYLGHRLAVRDEMSALENLEFLCRLQGAYATGADDALADLGLAGLQDVPAGRLSAGQRKRVALARLALDHRTLWLLDEPFANLDASGAERVAELIATHANRRGLTILSSHERPARALPKYRMLALEYGNG